MKISERAQKVLKALTRIGERELISRYIFWLGKAVGSPERFLSVVGIGCYDDDEIETFGNLLATHVNKHHTNPGLVLRNMAKETVHVACGPMPPLRQPHQVILVPLPSTWAALGPRKVKKILTDWRGTTMRGDIPYCIYTVWK